MPTTVVSTPARRLDADPVRVYDVLADFGRWSEWNPTFRARGVAAVGARLLILPRSTPLVLPARVRVADRGVALSWGGGGPLGAEAEHTLRLEATDDGCILHHQEVFEGPLAVVTRLVKGVLDGRYAAMDDALEARLSAA